VSLNQNKQLFALLLMASACHWPFTGDFSQCLACEYGAQSASASEKRNTRPDPRGNWHVRSAPAAIVLNNNKYMLSCTRRNQSRRCRRSLHKNV